MAFPIHPSRSDYDLDYSVLYDDYTAENAIKVIAILDSVTPFPPAPPPSYKVIVTYQAGTGGTIQGDTKEWVQAGQCPANVPFVTANRGYEFSHWSVDGVAVNPETTVVTKDTTFVAEFNFVGIYYDITYEAGDHGSLDGVLTQHLPEGAKLTFPDTIPDTDYMFEGWYRGNTPVDIDTEVASGNYTYTARFKVNRRVFTIDIYDVRPVTTATTSNGITHHQYQIDEGDPVDISWFTDTDAGPILNANGEYMSSFDEVPTGDTWYQRVDNTESLSNRNYYYRKTFYAARGGHLRINNQNVYANTQQISSWGGGEATLPTPVADSGWSFSHWINLANGNTVSNPTSGTTTAKYAAIFVEN